MSLSDSDSDFELPKLDGLSESDDEFADVFKPKKKQQQQSSIVDGDGGEDALDSYATPIRSHVCDECEGVFQEAVFCGECAMTYCLPCDQHYHTSGDELGLRSHFRQTLHGEVPKSLLRHMHQLEREEQEEAAAEAEKHLRPSAYRDEHAQLERTKSMRAREEEEKQAALANMPPASALAGEYAGLAPRPSPQSPTHQEYLQRSASIARGSPPPPQMGAAAADAWAAPAPAAAPSAGHTVTWGPNEFANAYPQAQGWFGSPSAVAVAPSPSSTQYASTLPRGSSSSSGRRSAGVGRPSSARAGGPVQKATMVLQSTRPTSATINTREQRGVVRTLPTRMGVSSSSTTLAGKTSFGKSVLLHSTPSAMVHQLLPARKRSTKGEKGAHAVPSKWGDLPTNALTLRELNEQIMSLKQEIVARTDQRSHYKTSILKKQRALKEISRIATNLAKQPNVASSLQSSKRLGVVPTSSSNSQSGLSGSPQDLLTKIQALKTSIEITRLEIEQISTKIQVLKDHSHLKDEGLRELSHLSRQRTSLIQQVSIDSAGRELDQFKKGQMMEDLQFAIEEMKKTIELKKRQVQSEKLNRMQVESQTRSLEQEYQTLQDKLDRWAARQVTQQKPY